MNESVHSEFSWLRNILWLGRVESECLSFMVLMCQFPYFLGVENGAEWISDLSACIWLEGKSMNAFHASICTSVTKNIEPH